MREAYVEDQRKQLDTAMQLKKELYVAYDYGMGGVWAIALAHSADEIRRLSPKLGVTDKRPDWMMGGVYASLQRFDVDDEASYPDWIQSIIADRRGDRPAT